MMRTVIVKSIAQRIRPDFLSDTDPRKHIGVDNRFFISDCFSLTIGFFITDKNLP